MPSYSALLCFSTTLSFIPSALILAPKHGIDDLIQVSSLREIILPEHTVAMHAERFIELDADLVIRVYIQPEPIRVCTFKGLTDQPAHRLFPVAMAFICDCDPSNLKFMGFEI